VAIEQVEPMHPEVVRALRAMSGAQRLQLAHEMWDDVRQRLIAYLGERHPEWSSDEINREVARRLLGDASGASPLHR
jgi:hypothetical protein